MDRVSCRAPESNNLADQANPARNFWPLKAPILSCGSAFWAAL
jgi:hypothetical protein